MYTFANSVSIPAGFSDALRQTVPLVNVKSRSLFQSLLGFLMRCDSIQRSGYEEDCLVSIPAGFSDALRHVVWATIAIVVTVSIPAGFSDALRRDSPLAWSNPGQVFQSLLGFLMRCDSGLHRS